MYDLRQLAQSGSTSVLSEARGVNPEAFLWGITVTPALTVKWAAFDMAKAFVLGDCPCSLAVFLATAL